MDSTDRKEGYGYLIDWIVRFGDLFLINIFFLLAFFIFRQDDVVTESLHYREKIIAFLLINLCYFLTSSFIRFHITSNVVYLDKIVQRSSAFITLYALLVTAGFSIFHIISIPIIPWIVGFFIIRVAYFQ